MMMPGKQQERERLLDPIAKLRLRLLPVRQTRGQVRPRLLDARTIIMLLLLYLNHDIAFPSGTLTKADKEASRRHGRTKELKTRDAEGTVAIELAYGERPETPLIPCHLEVDECEGKLSVVHEWLRWKRGSQLKRAGSGWSKTGANALLAVKCCFKNNRWPDFLDCRVCSATAGRPRIMRCIRRAEFSS